MLTTVGPECETYGAWGKLHRGMWTLKLTIPWSIRLAEGR